MSEEKKQYRVTNPVAWGGRRERGEILELTEKEAVEIGEVEPVVAVKAPVVAPAAPEAKPEPTGDYAPVKEPEEIKAEEEAAKAEAPAAPEASEESADDKS